MIASSWRGVPKKWAKAIRSTQKQAPDLQVLHRLNMEEPKFMQQTFKTSDPSYKKNVFMLTHACKTGQVSAVSRIHQEFTQTGMELTPELYTELITSYDKYGQSPTKEIQMIDLYTQATAKNIIFEIPIYDKIIEVFLRQENSQRASEVLTTMERHGLQITPSTLLTLMNNSVTTPSQMLKFMEYAKEHDMEVTDAIPNAIQNLFLQPGLSADVQKVLSWVIEDKFARSHFTPELCIRALWYFYEEKEITKIVDFLEIMKDNSVPQTREFYTFLLTFISKLLPAKLNAMLDVVNEMESKGYTLTFVENHLALAVYQRHHWVPGLDKMITALENYGLPPTSSVYEELILGYAKLDQLSLIDATFSRMETFGVKPKIETYDSLLSYGVFNDQKFPMESLFRALLDQGLRPSPRTYRTMLRYYSLKGSVSKVFSLLEEMTEHGLPIDLFGCNTLVSIFSDLGDVPQLQKTINLMERQGIDRNVFTYNRILRKTQVAPKARRMVQHGMLPEVGDFKAF